jgi:hypothetical protein
MSREAKEREMKNRRTGKKSKKERKGTAGETIRKGREKKKERSIEGERGEEIGQYRMRSALF